MTQETPEPSDGTPQLSEPPREPAWIDRAAIIVVVIVLITTAFFLGRYTADPGGAQVTDPCAEIYKMSDDLQRRPNADERFVLRTQMHLIVDHAECYAADVVASAKTVLEMPLLPGG